jgi:hypothetical protein
MSSRTDRIEERRNELARAQALAAQRAKAQEKAIKQASVSTTSKSSSSQPSNTNVAKSSTKPPTVIEDKIEISDAARKALQIASSTSKSSSTQQGSSTQQSSVTVSKSSAKTATVIEDKIETKKALQSSSQPVLVRTESTALKETQQQIKVEVPKHDTVNISEAAKKALLNEQTTKTLTTNEIKLSSSDKRLPKDIQNEIKHLQELYRKTEDKDVKKELNKLADNFRAIGKNRDDYTVLRINTFIPFDKVPLTMDEFYGGDNRGFDYKSTAVRTSQIILINTSKDKVYSANYIGKTHQYDGDGNMTGEELLKLKDGEMDVKNSKKGSKVNIVATISSPNPMVSMAPPIDYRMEFNVTKNAVTLVKGEESYDTDFGADIQGSKGSVIDGFPAYEIYGNIDGSGYQTLYKYKPESAFEIYKLVDGPGDLELPETTIKRK